MTGQLPPASSGSCRSEVLVVKFPSSGRKWLGLGSWDWPGMVCLGGAPNPLSLCQKQKPARWKKNKNQEWANGKASRTGKTSKHINTKWKQKGIKNDLCKMFFFFSRGLTLENNRVKSSQLKGLQVAINCSHVSPLGVAPSPVFATTTLQLSELQVVVRPEVMLIRQYPKLPKILWIVITHLTVR